MRWTAKDAKIIFEEKDYIDTALIPILPISFNKNGKDSANDSEFIELVTIQIEKQFKGRVFLMPPLTYFLTETDDEKLAIYHYWEQHIESGNFKHVFFITCDHSWQTMVHEKYECIWLPSVPIEHLEVTYKNSIIENQVKQILNFFVNKWQEEV